MNDRPRWVDLSRCAKCNKRIHYRTGTLYAGVAYCRKCWRRTPESQRPGISAERI